MSKGLLPQRGDWIIIALILTVIVSILSLFAMKSGNNTCTNNNKISVNSSDTIRKSKDYVGPPQYMITSRVEKYKKGTILDLNKIDSLQLIKVPGIGPAFAHRILSLRKLLGGYYTVEQLQEVYGIDEDKYLALKSWFKIKTQPKVYYLDSLKADELPNHIYLSYKQRHIMNKLIRRYGKICSWNQLMKESEFNYDDSVRLSHYFIERK